MKSLKSCGIAAFAACLMLAGTAYAQGPTNAEYYPVTETMSMQVIDTNKDGMVSKDEYMSMMAKAWDMGMKKMNLSGDQMTAAQLKEVLMYLKAGG